MLRAYRTARILLLMNGAARTVESYRAAGRKGWIRRNEIDQMVEANLPADLLPLWNRVRHIVKGSTVDQKTEAFLEYAEARQGDAMVAMIDDADRKLADLLAIRAERDARAQAAYDVVPF